MIDGVKENKEFLTNKEFIEKHESDISDLEQEIAQMKDQVDEIKKETQ